MSEALVVTPVKDSLETTKKTIEAISKAKGDFEYIVYNDFSSPETTSFLEKTAKSLNFSLINLSEITNTPSPNYKLVLELAQKRANEKKCPLLIIESDVIIQPDTIESLISIFKSEQKTGIIGAITTDKNGDYNFPYNYEKIKNSEIKPTNRSLSFCCTLLSPEFLNAYSFSELSANKDWFDVFISRQSLKLGFSNYLAKGIEVLHLPHSSRPWKNEKYTNPLAYYLKKYFKRRDRI